MKVSKKHFLFFSVFTGIIILVTMFIILLPYFLNLNKSSGTKISSDTSNIEQPLEQQTEDIEFTASFEIYTLGTKRDFSNPRYHNQSPDVFIESKDSHIIHVKKRDITWADFLATLPMELTKDCLVTGTKQTFCSTSDKKLLFYINGSLDSDALDKKIQPQDKLLVKYEYIKTEDQ